MRCGGCRRELEVGDRYIKDTASGFMGGGDPRFDGLIADIFGGNDKLDSGQSAEIFYCEDCTVSGGNYLFETVWGDEEV